MSEENTIKYTSDNKKVIVVGKLNSQETIVQEIFVSNGNEIPSGENFVVKSLHDAPAKSWKELELQKLEKRCDTRSTQIQNELSRLEDQYRMKSRTLKGLIGKQYSPEMLEYSIFDTIVDFLTGEITHVAIDRWSEYKIISFRDMLSTSDGYTEDLKLLTLFGTKDRGFDWRINDYRDGSGSNKQIYPCKSYEDAVEKINNLVKEKGGASKAMIEAKEKYGLDYPLDKDIILYYDSLKESVQKNLDNFLYNIEQREKEIKKIENKIKELNK